MSPQEYATLLAVFIAGMVIPGPDLLLVARVAIRSRRSALCCVVGIVAGLSVWISLTVTGAAAVLTRYPGAINAIRLLGGGWLCFMAYQLFKATWASRGQALNLHGQQLSSKAAFMQGFATNLSNPKALVYFLAVITPLLPASPGVGLAVWVIVLLVCTAWVGFSVLALCFSTGWLRRRFLRASQWIDAGTGVVFGVVGLGLVAEAVVGLVG